MGAGKGAQVVLSPTRVPVRTGQRLGYLTLQICYQSDNSGVGGHAAAPHLGAQVSDGNTRSMAPLCRDSVHYASNRVDESETKPLNLQLGTSLQVVTLDGHRVGSGCPNRTRPEGGCEVGTRTVWDGQTDNDVSSLTVLDAAEGKEGAPRLCLVRGVARESKDPGVVQWLKGELEILGRCGEQIAECMHKYSANKGSVRNKRVAATFGGKGLEQTTVQVVPKTKCTDGTRQILMLLLILAQCVDVATRWDNCRFTVGQQKQRSQSVLRLLLTKDLKPT
mmetsp:Transcript_13099/g.30206  ORF Transcript_13099/g.30206 Transcript_13099/m.30206 type:complete len:278 (-) Transcript_13099:433-1266(-)